MGYRHKSDIWFCDKGCFRNWQARRNTDWRAEHPEPAQRYRAVVRRRNKDIPHGWTREPGPAVTRALEIPDLFDRITNTSYDDNRQTWDRALAILNLKLCYQPAVAAVLKQGRWRKSKNPAGYVATASWRLALTMLADYDHRADEQDITHPRDEYGRPIRRRATPFSFDRAHGFKIGPSVKEKPERDDAPMWGDALTEDEKKDQRRYRSESGEPYKEHGIWKVNVGYDEPISPAEEVSRGLHAWLHGGDGHPINWDVAAEVAVSKGYMRRFVAKALHLRFDELVDCDEAVRRERKPDSKRAMAAAYKWIDRNHKKRIEPLRACPTKDDAIALLYGPPGSYNPHAAYARACAALNRITRQRESRPHVRDEGIGVGVVLDSVRYGF
jgi:hypothetical protein